MTEILLTALIGIITIVAIIYAPKGALKAQKKIESFNEKNSRKLDIFKTLMATRANRLSFEHVKALNMIDIEFYDDNNDGRTIIEAWNLYRDHLNSNYPSKDDKIGPETWENKSMEYFIDLLYAMSQYFGYTFDKVLLKKGVYNPQAHGWLETEGKLIRFGLANLLSGNAPLKVTLIEQPQPAPIDSRNHQNNIPISQ